MYQSSEGDKLSIGIRNCHRARASRARLWVARLCGPGSPGKGTATRDGRVVVGMGLQVR